MIAQKIAIAASTVVDQDGLTAWYRKPRDVIASPQGECRDPAYGRRMFHRLRKSRVRIEHNEENVSIMKASIRCVIIPLLMISFAVGKTITADVTGDGVSDQITMGLKIVAVRDGATGILHTVVSEVQYLADISVGDYFRGTKGNEIAVITLPDHEYMSEVYGYRNKQFVNVSKTLPGDISFNKEGRLFGYRIHTWNGIEVNIPWPIVDEGGFLKPAPLAEETDTHDVVEAFTTDEISFIMDRQHLIVCAAAVLEKDAIVFLGDEDGTLISQKTIGARMPFIATVYADKDKTITLSIDNSQSEDQKIVHYLIRHFTVPVMKR